MVFKKNFSTSGGSVEIVDNLTSTATDKALSAAQGKVLNDGKADASHNHDTAYADIAHETATNNPHSVTKSQVGLPNVDNTSDANKPVAVQRGTQTGLSCDFASHNMIICSISANASFTLSNVPTDELVTVMITNTGGSEVTVTMPNTADKVPAADYAIAASAMREFSIIYDGTTRYWQVSEEIA